MSRPDRFLWMAFAFSILIHSALFWAPEGNGFRAPEMTSRDLAFLIENLGPAEGSTAPPGEPAAASSVATSPSPADRVDPPRGDMAPDPVSTPEPPAPPQKAPTPAAAPVGSTLPPPIPAPAPLSSSPAPAALPPRPGSAHAGLTAEERLRALEEAASEVSIESPPLDPTRRKYVDQVEARVTAQYFVPEAARRGRLHGLVRLRAVVRRDGTIVELKLAERSGHSVLDAAAKLSVERAAPFPSLEGVVDFETLRILIPVRY